MRYDKKVDNRKIGGRGVAGWYAARFLALISSAFIIWCSVPTGLTDTACAQNPGPTGVVAGTKWAQSYNGPANCCENAPKIALDPQGNIFITGKSTTTRDSPGGSFNDGIATIKYDTHGNEMWVRRFDGPGYATDVPSDIATDTVGNVYVTGYSAGADSQYVTLKYDTDGNLLWARYAGSPLYDNAFALDVDGRGNVYITGREAYRFNPYNMPVYQFLTVKYDANGNEIWQRTFETPQQMGAEAADVKADDEGNVYVAGKGYLPSEPESKGYDIFAVKYDADGNELWVTQFSGDGPEYYNDDTASKLRLDGKGNLYLLGSTTKAPNQSDVLVLKYTGEGDLIQTILPSYPDNELSTDWAFDATGDIYVLSLKVIPGPNYSPVLDVVTFKLDADGNVVWRKLYASSGGGNDWGRGVVLDGKGSVYVGVDAQQGTTFNQNYVLVRYSALNGMKESENSYDGPAGDMDRLFGIAIDHKGDIYLTGETQADWATGRSIDFLTLKVASTTRNPRILRPRPKY
jgi:hypothetical protein